MQMTTTIYLDILILINLFVTYFLLLDTQKLMNLRLKKWRVLLGTLMGGAYSLLILWEVSALELVLVKLGMGISLVAVVFLDLRHPQRVWKDGLCFFAVNFVFAGFMAALWMFAAPRGMQYKNGVAYFNISALTLAVSTVAAYLVISLFSSLLNRRNRLEELREVVLSLGDKQVRLTGLADSGNKLCDLFSGLPVIVCEYDAVQGLLPEGAKRFFTDFSEKDPLPDWRALPAFRMIPIQAVNGRGSLPAFRPEDVQVDRISRQAMIAVTTQPLSDGHFQAVLPTALI